LSSDLVVQAFCACEGHASAAELLSKQLRRQHYLEKNSLLNATAQFTRYGLVRVFV